jgi:hypothetical protein
MGLQQELGDCATALAVGQVVADPLRLAGGLPCGHMPADQRISPAMRLTEPPTMTTPNRYDTKAWTSTVCRILGSATVVSDTW